MKCFKNTHDPWVFRWGNFPEQSTFDDWPRIVGLFMPCWRSRSLIERAVKTLRYSMPVDYPFGLVVVDGGSHDGTVEWLVDANVPVVTLPQPRKACMNEMVELWLGKYDKQADRFEYENRVGYVGFMHTDADYGIDFGWLPRLVTECANDLKIGCIGPAYDDATGALSYGNHLANCPIFIIPVRVIKAFYRRYGWWIDPNYWSGTSYCDWDMQWHLRELGFKSVVSTKARIKHFCQGTRAELWVTEPDFRRRDQENKDYYHSKWPEGVNPLAEAVQT